MLLDDPVSDSGLANSAGCSRSSAEQPPCEQSEAHGRARQDAGVCVGVSPRPLTCAFFSPNDLNPPPQVRVWKHSFALAHFPCSAGVMEQEVPCMT